MMKYDHESIYNEKKSRLKKDVTDDDWYIYIYIYIYVYIYIMYMYMYVYLVVVIIWLFVQCMYTCIHMYKYVALVLVQDTNLSTSASSRLSGCGVECLLLLLQVVLVCTYICIIYVHYFWESSIVWYLLLWMDRPWPWPAWWLL